MGDNFRISARKGLDTYAKHRLGVSVRINKNNIKSAPVYSLCVYLAHAPDGN